MSNIDIDQAPTYVSAIYVKNSTGDLFSKMQIAVIYNSLLDYGFVGPGTKPSFRAYNEQYDEYVIEFDKFIAKFYTKH